MRALSLIAVLLLAACSTPASRIRKSQAAYDAYPPAVQEKIRRGEVDVGFTPEQVKMALGKPDRVYERKSATAAGQEVWAWGGGGSSGPRVGFGLGMSTGGPSVFGAGVGVGTDTGYEHADDRVRVVFEGGTVVSVEARRK